MVERATDRPVANPNLGGVGTRVDELDRRLDELDRRLDGLDRRLDGLDDRLGELERRRHRGVASQVHLRGECLERGGVRLRVAQRVGRGNHRRCVEPERGTVLQLIHPLPEAPAGEFDQFVQRRRTGAFLGHPQVEYLLHRPARFAEPGQADHAARTLEGVESATDRGQERLVGRRTARLRVRPGYRLQHLPRLAEEDPEQFAVDLGLVALGFDRLHRRGRWRRARDPGERGLQRRFVGPGAGVEQRDRIARPGLQRAVVDQLRVFAQLLERLAQFTAQRDVVGRLSQRPDQLAGALGVPGQHEFRRIHGRRSWRTHHRALERHDHRRRLAPRLAQLGAESTACGVEREAGARVPWLLQAVDEETECAQTGCEQLAVTGARHRLGG